MTTNSISTKILMGFYRQHDLDIDEFEMLTPAELKAIDNVPDSTRMSEQAVKKLIFRLGITIVDDDVLPMMTHYFYHQPYFKETQGWHYKQIAHKIHKGWLELSKIGPDSTKDDLVSLMTFTERPYRLPVFTMAMDRMGSHPDFASDILLDIWIGAEVFSRAGVQDFMDVFKHHQATLRQTLSNIPVASVHKLYHGIEYKSDEYRAHSWTFDPKIADFFARRFNAYGRAFVHRDVLKIKITHAQLLTNALFYTNDRNENEVFFLNDPRFMHVKNEDLTLNMDSETPIE